MPRLRLCCATRPNQDDHDEGVDARYAEPHREIASREAAERQCGWLLVKIVGGTNPPGSGPDPATTWVSSRLVSNREVDDVEEDRPCSSKPDLEGPAQRWRGEELRSQVAVPEAAELGRSGSSRR
jgi:hypothetical protein